MRGAPESLHRRSFDVLVVGGGIHGAALAREAALRGARVLLVERQDFGCGTSMRSSRLVHGGVRYLEQGHLRLVREALHERERLLRLAPHLVRPLPMLMPFFEDGGKRPWKLRLGLRLYQLLAGRSTLPGPRAHDAAACRVLFPGLRATGLRGGVSYWDAATSDLRLTLAVLESAAAAGAVLVNHVVLAGVAPDGALRLTDDATGNELLVRARLVLNAAGPQADHVRRLLGIDAPPLVRTTRGSHVVLAPRDTETALAAFLPDGRIQFVIPHRDGTLCGTTDVDDPVDGAADADADATAPSSPTVPESDVRYLLQALAWMLEAPPSLAEVRFAYAGWRSLPAAAGPPGQLNREAFTVAEPCAAALSSGERVAMHTLVGGKLTTHRAFAERTIAALLAAGDRSPSRSRTLPLPGGDGPHEVGDPLWWRHGSRAAVVRALAAGEPSWLEPLCPHRDLLRAEAVFALRVQGAVTFTDLMLRRLVHAQGPCLEDSCLRQAFALYLRERRHGGGDSFDGARADLIAEVRHLTGGFGLAAEAPGQPACPPGYERTPS